MLHVSLCVQPDFSLFRRHSLSCAGTPGRLLSSAACGAQNSLRAVKPFQLIPCAAGQRESHAVLSGCRTAPRKCGRKKAAQISRAGLL